MIDLYTKTDFQHKLYSLTLDNNLYIAPIIRNPKHVLDVATGTGIWAVEFGKMQTKLMHIMYFGRRFNNYTSSSTAPRVQCSRDGYFTYTAHAVRFYTDLWDMMVSSLQK